MPRKAAYLLASIQALPAQTVYASAEASRRQMLAAEAIIPSIDPNEVYELSETLSRIVGPQFQRDVGERVAGEVLRADLVTLVLDLSARLSLDGSERAGGAATPEELAREIGVASKTLQRWRRTGLCAHWVIERGKPRVAIYRDCLRQFAQAHQLEFARACSFRRFCADERARMLEEGRALIAAGKTLNLAAKELAQRAGRSHEGVRLLFLRELGAQRAPRRGVHEQAARFAERAWRLGIDPSRIAQRLDRSESLVRALVDRRRAEILRGVQPSWVELSTFELPGADETIPCAPAARKPQLLGLQDGDVLAAILSARTLRAAFPRDGRAAAERDETRAAAMHYLLRRASRAIDALPKWPERSRIDQIETDLRTALRLREALVERGLIIAWGRADHLCAGAPERLPSDELRSMARAIGNAVREIVTNFDPSRQRFDRAISLAADLALAKLVSVRRTTRAAVRHAAGLPMRLLGDLAQWESLVEPPNSRRDRVMAALAEGSNSPKSFARRADVSPDAHPETLLAAQLLARRYGWGGYAPATVERLAEEDRTTVALMTKRLRDVENRFRG